MNELALQTSYQRLPQTVEELVDFILVGNEAVKSFKAKLRAASKANIAKNARDAALRDGRTCSKMVIEAESRLGELLTNSQKVPVVEPSGNGSLKGSEHTLPSGLDKKQSHYAQEIYRHPEIVEEVFTEYESKEDIPTKHAILKKIKERKRAEKIQEQKEEIKQGLEKPTGKYDILVVDPPWTFDGGEQSYDADGRRGTATYPTMSYEQIKNEPIPELSKENSILWLWTTHKDIWVAKEILEHWGFTYKGILVWNKEKMGIGTWLRFQCEFCLLGVKGKPFWEYHDIRDYISEPRKKHSEKPECFYDLINKKFMGSKLDYFGRVPREGWEVYGAGKY